MSDDLPPVIVMPPPELESGGKRPDPKPGEKGFIGGLPTAELRRIKAKARRYCDNYDEFLHDAKRAMFEHALKVEAMCRYSEDSNQVALTAASFRKAVSDIAAAHAPAAKAKK